MLQLTAQELINKIIEKSGLSEEEIRLRIKRKLDDLAGLISEEGAAHIVANELGIKLTEEQGKITINKLIPGMRNIELEAKIRQKYELREFNNETRKGKIASMLIADETGTTRLVLWNEQAEKINELKEGDIIRIKRAYVRDNNGRTEVHLSETGELEINPEGVSININLEATQKPNRKRIKELTEQDQNVEVIATIVQVFEPRFFASCPECNSRLNEEGKCTKHGTVTPKYNYVMNLYLDDGSDNIRGVFWREQVNKLLGKTEEELINMKDEPGAFEEYKTELLGMIIKIRGRVQKNQNFGKLELIAQDLEKDINPEEELKKEEEQEETKELTEKEITKKPEGETTTETNNEPKEDEELERTVTEEVFTLDDLEDLDELDE